MAVDRGFDTFRMQPVLAPGESFRHHCKNVTLQINMEGGVSSVLETRRNKGSHQGHAYLTTQRFIFARDRPVDGEFSCLSMPFYCLQGIEVKQPIFGANYLAGYIRADDHGGWQGRAKFTMTFSSGGAIEFAMLFIDLLKQSPPNPPPYQYAATAPAATAPPAAIPVAKPVSAYPTAPAAHAAVPTAPPAMAGATAYYDPNQPHNMYVPAQPSAPPAGDDRPPAYDDVVKKTQ